MWNIKQMMFIIVLFVIGLAYILYVFQSEWSDFSVTVIIAIITMGLTYFIIQYVLRKTGKIDRINSSIAAIEYFSQEWNKKTGESIKIQDSLCMVEEIGDETWYGAVLKRASGSKHGQQIVICVSENKKMSYCDDKTTIDSLKLDLNPFNLIVKNRDILYAPSKNVQIIGGMPYEPKYRDRIKIDMSKRYGIKRRKIEEDEDEDND